MNYYFKLSEPSDDDVIETDDYLEHAASKNPDNQLYVFDRVWKDSEGHWRVDLKNTVTGATATKIGIDPKYEGKPLSFNAVKSTVRYALNNHKIAIKDSEVDKIVYTFMRLAPQFFTETGRSNYTINRGDSKNPKKSTSTLPPQYLKHSASYASETPYVNGPNSTVKNLKFVGWDSRFVKTVHGDYTARLQYNYDTVGGANFFIEYYPGYNENEISNKIRSELKEILPDATVTPAEIRKGAAFTVEGFRKFENSLSSSKKSMRHSVTIDSAMCAVVPTGEELSHYGVEGMKWGIRRYQNKDGTLTDEGRARYHVKSSAYKLQDKYERRLKTQVDYAVASSKYKKLIEDAWDDSDPAKRQKAMEEVNKIMMEYMDKNISDLHEWYMNDDGTVDEKARRYVYLDNVGEDVWSHPYEYIDQMMSIEHPELVSERDKATKEYHDAAKEEFRKNVPTKEQYITPRSKSRFGYGDYANELNKEHIKEHESRENTKNYYKVNKNKLLENAKKYDSFDMEFLESNGDLGKNGEKLEGKQLMAAYTRYLDDLIENGHPTKEHYY